MVTKFLIVSLCILAGTMGGLIFSKKLTKRAQYYSSLLNLTNEIISEVKFRKNTTKMILSEYAQKDKTPLVAHLNDYVACENLGELKLSRSVVKPAEAEDVKKFLLSLGTLDTDTQVIELENYKNSFAKISGEAEEKRKKFGGMYIKLGFFAGLAVGILIL